MAIHSTARLRRNTNRLPTIARHEHGFNLRGLGAITAGRVERPLREALVRYLKYDLMEW
jgi:hypothetical protein